jgi:ABC-2 type transport system ATP-binding protein
MKQRLMKQLLLYSTAGDLQIVGPVWLLWTCAFDINAANLHSCPSGWIIVQPDLEEERAMAVSAREAEVFVRVADLHRQFNGNGAVNGVSFDIQKGEIFGLLGPNGAGKTTTIRMMATTLRPSSGEVTIGGYRVTDQADQVRGLIGVCPQDIALYMELTALDNLVFFGRMEGLTKAEAVRRAMVNLELVGLTERARGRVSKFSGGMKRRVNLAAALMNRPALLFLDEPTVGVDPQSRNRVFDAILGLRDQGMTMLYTTHYMEEADRLCDRVGIMDGGRIVALGAPAELKARHGASPAATLEDVFLSLTGRRLRDGV